MVFSSLGERASLYELVEAAIFRRLRLPTWGGADYAEGHKAPRLSLVAGVCARLPLGRLCLRLPVGRGSGAAPFHMGSAILTYLRGSALFSRFGVLGLPTWGGSTVPGACQWK